MRGNPFSGGPGFTATASTTLICSECIVASISTRVSQADREHSASNRYHSPLFTRGPLASIMAVRVVISGLSTGPATIIHPAQLDHLVATLSAHDIWVWLVEWPFRWPARRRACESVVNRLTLRARGTLQLTIPTPLATSSVVMFVPLLVHSPSELWRGCHPSVQSIRE
jgi:hypothetical protein